MTPRPVPVAPDEHLDIARALMVACRFRHLPVVRRGELVGLLSFRELVAADLSSLEASDGERARHLRQLDVAQAMRPAPIFAAPTTTVEAAASALLRHRLSCLPVVSEGALVGIATYSDFLGLAAERLTGDERVEQLMTPRPITSVGPDDRLDIAWSILKSAGIRHLPVVVGERLVGLVNDLDLLAADGSWLMEDLRRRIERRASTRVREIMSAHAITVEPEAPARHAAELLGRRHLGALPVVRGDSLVGVISAADFFHHLVAA
jgi:CBS domain-containing protein